MLLASNKNKPNLSNARWLYIHSTHVCIVHPYLSTNYTFKIYFLFFERQFLQDLKFCHLSLFSSDSTYLSFVPNHLYILTQYISFINVNSILAKPICLINFMSLHLHTEKRNCISVFAYRQLNKTKTI